MGGEIGLMHLGAAGKHGGDKGNSEAAAKIAHQVDHGRDLVVLLLRHTDVADGVDGDEEESQSNRLVDAIHHGGSEIDAQIERTHVEHGRSQSDEAEGDQFARIDARDQVPDDGHHGHDHQASGRKRHAGQLRGVSHHGLQKLRNQDGGAVEHETEGEHQQVADGEVAVLQQTQIQNRMRLTQLPDERNRAVRQRRWR